MYENHRLCRWCGKSFSVENEKKLLLVYNEFAAKCRNEVMATANNTKKIAEYIKTQLEEDKLHDQLTLKEYDDPFKGDK